MDTSRTKKDGKSPTGGGMSDLAGLRDEPTKAVVGRRLRTMPARQRREIDISARHQKALCLEDHEPRYRSMRELGRADPIIRAKVILDVLPDDVALRVAHMRWDDPDDHVEFYRVVLRSLIGNSL